MAQARVWRNEYPVIDSFLQEPGTLGHLAPADQPTLRFEMPAVLDTLGGALNVRLDLAVAYRPTAMAGNSCTACAFCQMKAFRVFGDDVVNALLLFHAFQGTATAQLFADGTVVVSYVSLPVAYFDYAAMDKAVLWALENSGNAVPLAHTYSSVNNGNAYFVVETDLEHECVLISPPSGRWRHGAPIPAVEDEDVLPHAAFLTAAALHTARTSTRGSIDPPPNRFATYGAWFSALAHLLPDDGEDDDPTWVPEEPPHMPVMSARVAKPELAGIRAEAQQHP